MLTMTDDQKYAEVLKELGALLAENKTTISCQKWQIEDLKAKLESAEAELREDTKAFDEIMHKTLERNEQIAALCAVSAWLMDCVNLAALEEEDLAKIMEAQDEIREIIDKMGGAA